MNKKVAIVILNWNGEKMLKEYLPSVIQYYCAIRETRRQFMWLIMPRQTTRCRCSDSISQR